MMFALRRPCMLLRGDGFLWHSEPLGSPVLQEPRAQVQSLGTQHDFFVGPFCFGPRLVLKWNLSDLVWRLYAMFCSDR